MQPETLGTFVLDTSLRAAAAAAAVAIVLLVLRVRAAGVRHAAWTGVVGAMLLMPILPSYAPRVEVPLPSPAVAWLADGEPATAARTEAPPLPPLSVPVIIHAMQNAPRAAEMVSDRYGAALLGAAFLYTSGTLLLLGQLFIGWRAASKMVARAETTPLIAPARVLVSPEVVTPVTAGILRPSIVLPRSWTTWPEETLRAVLAHEGAHVRRRDGLVLCMARINRAVFWFHPLAWWLERTLAVTAEHACDEAATRAIGEPRRYARILLQMAKTVRANRGRIVWQGVGVDGAGLLGTRIERVLRGDFMRASRARKLTAAVSCAAALLLVIACRQQIAPLREDPEVAKKYADQEASTKRFEAARDLTQPQADALEARIAANPQDWEAREQLVTYYRASTTVTWDKKVPGLRRHALWLIEHAPEHQIQAPPLSPQYDPEGFAAAKRLWEAHLAKPDASPFLIYRAASFFAPHDKPYAEHVIIRGASSDPGSAALTARMPPDVGGYQWDYQLASLYGSAILGSESVSGTYNDLRTRPERLETPFAVKARAKLAETKDPILLSRVGSSLVSLAGRPDGDPNIRALGRSYLERALVLKPDLASARASLLYLEERELAHRVHDAEQAGRPVDEADKLRDLAMKGASALIGADSADYYAKNPEASKRTWAIGDNKKRATGDALRKTARTNAEEALRLAETRPQDPHYSSVVMAARQTLAGLAAHDGNADKALKLLNESLAVPPSDAIKHRDQGAWFLAVNKLLELGERERVAAFLEALAQVKDGRSRERLLNDAKSIREGRMTPSYQRVATRRM